MKTVVDNDILLKGACYGLLPTLIACVPGGGAVGILGASKFVVPKMILRIRLQGDPAAALACFAAFVEQNEVLEPSTQEQQMAAFLEAAAQEKALNLDAGESQLVAILVTRCLPCMVTGDKRAIASLEDLLDSDARLAAMSGKIRCLEQLIASALVAINSEEMRRAICAEPAVDKTLSICFSCSSATVDFASVVEGLESYIVDIRARAPRVLAT
jgi:hypothetical protein